MNSLLLLLCFLFVSNPQDKEVVIASGTWTKKSYSVSGKWQLIRKSDGTHVILLDDDFKTRKAPDLKIFLSMASAAALTSSNALSKATQIAELDSHSGAQQYVIPKSVDMNKVSSVLIHCEQYEVLWAVSALSLK